MPGQLGVLQRQLGQLVLGDLDRAACFLHSLAKFSHLTDSHARIVGDDHHAAVLPRLVERGDELAFLRSIHFCSLHLAERALSARIPRVAPCRLVGRRFRYPSSPCASDATVQTQEVRIGANRTPANPSPVSCRPSSEALGRKVPAPAISDRFGREPNRPAARTPGLGPEILQFIARVQASSDDCTRHSDARRLDLDARRPGSSSRRPS